MDANNNVVLNHNLLANDDTDAKSKCNVLVDAARDKSVCSACFELNPKPTQRPCKVKLGDFVHYPKPDLYGMTGGKIIEIHRAYKRIDKYTGKFESGGLLTSEDMIESICLPYTFDGETLTVTYPVDQFRSHEVVETSKFYGYTVVAQNERMCTIFMDHRVKKLTV